VSFIEGQDRAQFSLLPPSIDDYIVRDSLVRVVDAFVDSLDLGKLGFERTTAASTGGSGFRPSDMLRLYIPRSRCIWLQINDQAAATNSEPSQRMFQRHRRSYPKKA
jgi:hypothetical protein